MPWSRPNSFRRSSFSSLDAVEITVAPACLASWIAAMPTPPAPAWIRTVCPASRLPAVNRHSWAVPNATGTQAAGAASSPSGIGQVDIAGTARFAACEPATFRVTTRSPTARSSTPAPTSDDRARGEVADDVRDDGGGDPARWSRSPPSMLIASTSITTQPSGHSGSGTSS